MLYPIFRATHLQKPDWDGCSKKFKEEFEDDDIVIISYDGSIPTTLEYYCELNNFDFSKNSYQLKYTEDEIEDFFEYIEENNITRIWLIDFWEHIIDPDNLTKELLIDEYNLTKEEKYEFRLDISLTLYELS